MTTSDVRERIARAIHDSPNAQKQLRDAGVRPHTWDECDNGVDTRDQYRADADALLTAFPWLADKPSEAEVEAAISLREALLGLHEGEDDDE